MVSITVVVQYPDGNNEKRLELTIPDKTKVWRLSSLLEWKLKTGISAEIAIGEEVLIGRDRLQPVVEGTTYILTALEEL